MGLLRIAQRNTNIWMIIQFSAEKWRRRWNMFLYFCTSIVIGDFLHPRMTLIMGTKICCMNIVSWKCRSLCSLRDSMISSRPQWNSWIFLKRMWQEDTHRISLSSWRPLVFLHFSINFGSLSFSWKSSSLLRIRTIWIPLRASFLSKSFHHIWVVTGQVNDHWSQYIPNCKAFVVNHFSDVNAEQSLKLMINIRQTGSCGNEMNRWNFSDEQWLQFGCWGIAPTCGKYDWSLPRPGRTPPKPKTFPTNRQSSRVDHAPNRQNVDFQAKVWDRVKKKKTRKNVSPVPKYKWNLIWSNFTDVTRGIMAQKAKNKGKSKVAEIPDHLK